MSLYAINDTTLTALGDAIRGKTEDWIYLDAPTSAPFEFTLDTRTAEVGEYTGLYTRYFIDMDLREILGDKFDVTDNLYLECSYEAHQGDTTTPLYYNISFAQIETVGSSSERSSTLVYAEGSAPVAGTTTKTQEALFSVYPCRRFSAYINKSLAQNRPDWYLVAHCKLWPLSKTDKFIEKNTMTPLEMAEAIEALNIPDINPIILTGNCSYACCGVLASQFIDAYGDKISTSDITHSSSMFYGGQCEVIPFEINFKSGTAIDMASMFNNNAKLQRLPKINNAMPSGMQNFCSSCNYLQEVPEDYGADWDWSQIDNATSGYAGSRANTFAYCGGLRKLPMKFLEHGNPVCNYSYSIYNCLAQYCYALDEIVGLPIPHAQAGWTSNAFSYAFDNCSHAQRFTFKTAEDGSPIVVNWKNQVINLANYFGYSASYQLSNITRYSGITADKEVKNDATYQALKNDPDWFTGDVNYSRYNHDSAVETINSLPDCSATGTNTIKFKGASGALTDGGAINTLTEEEIAVAAAKGWTVTLS